MPTRPIKIIGSNASTGRLELDDHGHTIAAPGDTILWQINHDSGVGSIELINEKTSTTNIWSAPPYQQGANWRGDISRSAPPLAVYAYSITWKSGNDTHTHDPIISIRPSTINIERIALIVLVTVLTILTLGIFSKKKKKWKL